MVEYKSAEQKDDIIRTSSLTEVTLLLTGYEGSLCTIAFDPKGELLVSGSFNMTCTSWNSTGNFENLNILCLSHKNAILDMSWSHNLDFITTALVNKTIGWCNFYASQRIKRFVNYDSIVNTADTCHAETSSPNIIVSSSDDSTARMWDTRISSNHVSIFQHEY